MDEVIKLQNDYIEYTECEYGIVAVAIVDAIKNGIEWDLLDENAYDEDSDYFVLLNNLKTLNVDALLDKAINVIEIIKKDNSELREVWEENEQMHPLWFENLEKISNRLKNAKKEAE